MKPHYCYQVGSSNVDDSENSLANRRKSELFSTFDNMCIVMLPDAVRKALNEQSDVLEHRLKSKVLSPDRKYFDDPRVQWYSQFFGGYKTPARFPFTIGCLPKDWSNPDRPGTLPFMTGYIETTSVNVNSIRLKYNYRIDTIFFRIGISVAFRPFLEETITDGKTYKADEKIGSLKPIPISFVYDIPVPIPLLATWLRGKLEDRPSNVLIRGDDFETIEYEIWSKMYNNINDLHVTDGRFIRKYPKSFMEWIRRNRLRIFAYFNEAECEIDDNVRAALIKSMNFDIKEASHSRQPTEDELQQTADLVSEALKIPSLDRKRLKEIDLVKGPLSYSQWSERLWFNSKSKGAVGQFFERMRRLGLISIRQEKSGNKNTGSTVVQLTPTAKVLLQAIEEHLNLEK